MRITRTITYPPELYKWMGEYAKLKFTSINQLVIDQVVILKNEVDNGPKSDNK